MARRWYYSHDGKSRFGPISTSELRDLARSGALQPVSLVLLEGGRKWVKAGTIRGLFPAGAGAAPRGGLPYAATAAMALVVLLLLGGIIALLIYQATRREANAPVAAVTQPESQAEPPDPPLFADERPNFASKSKPEQEKIRQQAEAVYLDPAKPDKDHVAAANTLLGVTDGHRSLLKGLDAYDGDRPGARRRYRWCLQYLTVAQQELDLKHRTRPGEAPGIIPAKHVLRMAELLRGLDPNDPAARAQIATTLNYLEQHPEHAGPALPILRELAGRYAGNAELSQDLRNAVAAAGKKP